MSQSVTFKGHGLVYHPTKGRMLCRFVNGEYSTTDAEEIGILAKTFDHSIIEAPAVDEQDMADKPKRGRPKNATL